MTPAPCAHDQFDSVFGAGRGGGHSHTVLPAVTDRDSFNTVIAALAADADLAESPVGRDALTSLTFFTHVESTTDRRAVKVNQLLNKLDITADGLATHAAGVIPAHIDAFVRGGQPLTEDPLEAICARYIRGRAEWLIRELTSADVGSPTLKLLLEPGHYDKLVAAAGENRYREIHGAREAACLHDYWTWVDAIDAAVRLPTLNSAQGHIYTTAAAGL